MRKRGWNPLRSPLTRRLLVVNLVAPIILAAGLLYLDRYKQGLIRSELAGLTTQAEMIAGAVGEGAVGEQAQGFLEINQDQAQHMVRRLAKSAQIRARLFDSIGGLAADSRFLLSPKGNIRIEDLAPPRRRGWLSAVQFWWDWAGMWMPLDESLPVYLEPPTQRAEYFPEAVAALNGYVQGVVRTNPQGGIVLSAAVPVQRFKQVVGAMMVSHDGSRVARALFQVRVAIAQAFMASLAVTVALSLYMAGTIARPVRRLALAAEMLRNGHGRGHRIPDLSARGDEIGELSVALKDMTEALWARMDAIERFAADVSHEIKNPLTSVRSAVETAARISDPEKQKKLLAIIGHDVERLNRLITDISDASRVDAELSRADSEPVELTGLLDILAEVYRSTCEEQQLNFIVDVPADDRLTVRGIEGRVVQVLRNLIGNAVSFSPQGGTITLSGERRDNCVRLTVEDDGPGIPADKLDAVFERFYTERPPAEQFGNHSGLGLSISKQIIDAHNGGIWAENRDQGGARFVVELPLA